MQDRVGKDSGMPGPDEASSDAVGTLFVGDGYIDLDGWIGENAAHSHLAFQLSIGLDGPIELVGEGETRFVADAVLIAPNTRHWMGPIGRRVRSVYVEPQLPLARLFAGRLGARRMMGGAADLVALAGQLVVGSDGSESMGNASVHYRDRRWELQSTYVRIGERFNDEMGFVPRTGVWKFDSTYGARFRPSGLSKWLRELFPHLGVTNVSWLRSGELQSRLIGAHMSINLQDGSGGEIGVDPTTENLIVPFLINRRRGIIIPVGRYDFNDWHATWRTNASAPFSVNGRVDVGDFYDGHRQSYGGGAAVRVGGRLNAAITESRNQIQLLAGSYTTDLITARVEYGFSTIAFANALIQYNTDAREWTSNLRFNVIHHRLSDFFLVFNERRDSSTRGLLDRALVAKVTQMVAF